MGEVYAALDAKLARRVAIKVLPDSMVANADSLARFEREARALAALQHPGILAIHDFGRDGDRVYAVTELLEGSTLRHKLKRGALPIPQCLDLGIQLADALAAAHERGIVHRDLKPGNIFILRDGRMKLLDFGLAKQIPIPPEALRERSTQPIQSGGGDTEPGLLLGTVGYMAPEQVKGEPMDGRTDIFAFGCLFSELCTGRRIFQRETLVETLHAIIAEEPELKDPRVSAPLEQLTRRCMNKDPGQRFQSARDLRYALECLSEVHPAPAEPPTVLRRPWMLPALTACLILGVGALGSMLWKPSAPTPRFRPMTFRHGQIYAARFTADGSQVVYTARWGVEAPRLFMASSGSHEARSFGAPGCSLLAVSPGGDLALLQAIRQHPRDMDRILGRLVQTKPLSWAPQTLAEGVTAADWAPDGKGLAVVRRIDGHERLEYPIGTTLWESAGWMSHLRFDRSGHRLAYLDHPRDGEDGGAVVLMDLDQGRRQVLSDGWSSLQGLAWAPRSDEVWFTASKGTDLRALHAASLGGKARTLLTAPLDLLLQDVSDHGSALLCQSTSFGGVLAKAAAGDPLILDPYRLTRAEGLAEDGRWLVIANADVPSTEEPPLLLHDLQNARTVPLGTGRYPTPSPDGSRLLVCHEQGGKWRLFVRDLPAGNPVRLPFEGFSSLRGVAWHPSGQALVVCGAIGAEPLRVWHLGLDQPQPQPLTPEGVDPSRPFRLSPDGHWLVMALGPIVYRVDLLDLSAAPLPLPGIAPSDRLLGFEDGDHLLLASGQTLPDGIERYVISSGKRQPGFTIPALGHEGALLDRTFQTAHGGAAFAGSYLELRSNLFLVEGLK